MKQVDPKPVEDFQDQIKKLCQVNTALIASRASAAATHQWSTVSRPSVDPPNKQAVKLLPVLTVLFNSLPLQLLLHPRMPM